VELEGFEDRLPAELSGGQRKRAGLARAIAFRPKYLLYDEPTSGLDPVTTTVIDRLILKMKEELGVTSLVITHDMGSAYRVSDRIAMLYEGRGARGGNAGRDPGHHAPGGEGVHRREAGARGIGNSQRRTKHMRPIPAHGRAE
jgi:ABC-type glutathione transport system ATPase component